MKRVFRAEDALIVGFLRDVLENAGIRCLLRNEHLGGAAGQVPPLECWPEIWVTDDADAGRAERLLGDTLRERDDQPAWSCPGCGESIESQFGRCWNCGQPCPVIG